MRRQTEKIDPIRSKFGQIEREEVSLDEKMKSVRTYAESHSSFYFSALMMETEGKNTDDSDIHAILELIEDGRADSYAGTYILMIY